MSKSTPKTFEWNFGDDTLKILVVNGWARCPADGCRKKFQQLDTMARHISRHDGYSRQKSAVCDECGQTFGYYPRPSESGRIRGRFCSQACHAASRVAEYTCEECGEEFVDGATKDRQYCGRECQRAALQAGKLDTSTPRMHKAKSD